MINHALIEEIESRFTSHNSVPVRDIRLTYAEWEELRHLLAGQGCRTCAQVYQVVGTMLGTDSAVVPVLDNLSASADGRRVPHETLLPYPEKCRELEPVKPQ